MRVGEVFLSICKKCGFGEKRLGLGLDAVFGRFAQRSKKAWSGMKWPGIRDCGYFVLNFGCCLVDLY